VKHVSQVHSDIENPIIPQRLTFASMKEFLNFKTMIEDDDCVDFVLDSKPTFGRKILRKPRSALSVKPELKEEDLKAEHGDQVTISYFRCSRHGKARKSISASSKPRKKRNKGSKKWDAVGPD
jgi:hypothetical protein